MKTKTITLIASISLVIFGVGVFGFLRTHNNKLLNLHLAHQQKLKPDSNSPVPISKGRFLLLLAVGAIGALSAHRIDKASRSTSQTKSTQKPDGSKFNPSRIPVNMGFFGLNESHMETLDELQNAVCGDANFIILTGDSGTGKSKLIQFLKKEILPEYIILEIGNEVQDARDLYALLAAHTGLNNNFKSKGAFFIHFNRYLHTVQAERKKILLIIDDFTAKNEILIKELKFLSNITIEYQRIIKILVTGENISSTLYEPHKPMWTTISVNKEIFRKEFNPIKSGQENNYRRTLGKTEQTKALLDNSLRRFKTWKLFEQPINFAGIIKQDAIDGFTTILAKIHSFIQNTTLNLYLKQRKYWRTIFFSSGLFDSFLWNSVLSVSLFAFALTFALWYQGILPIKKDVSVSEDFQRKYHSIGTVHESFRDKEVLKIPERFTIIAKKQLNIEQKLSGTNRQNESKPKLPANQHKSAGTDYFVQVGAFLIKENAVKTVHKLKENGYLAKIVTLTDTKDRIWYTVRIGEYSSLKIAKKHAAEFSNQEKMDSIVLPFKRH